MRLLRRSAALLLLACAGCSGRAAPDGGGASGVVPSQLVTLVVENHHWADVTIWAISGGQRTRLGDATAAQSASLRIPGRLLQQSDVQFVARAIGSGTTILSDVIPLRELQRIIWTLESDLRRSTIGIW